MSNLQENVLELDRFRLKKQNVTSSHFSSSHNTSIGISTKELENHIANIRNSIQRINNLMKELKTISDKPNKDF